MLLRAVLGVMLVVSPALAQEPPAVRYISDETAITLREGKGMEAPVAGLLTTGTKVELLETDSTSGYAHVRVGPGREGWVLARYLSPEPAARERLAKVEAALAEQIAQVRRLETENLQLRRAAATPAAAASEPAAVAEEAQPAPPASGPSRLVNLLTGVGLVVAGLLSGLLLPLLRSPRTRRRNNWSQL